jgi:GNAT superfamily N-acetyltransferase
MEMSDEPAQGSRTAPDLQRLARDGGRLTHALDIRPVQPQEVSALLDFYRANCEYGDRVARLFEWRSSAPGRANAPWAAWRDGELLGTVNTVPCPIVGGGDQINAIWQQDSIVLAATRGKGVGRVLVERAADGWPIVLAKGTGASMYRLRISVGFRDAPNDTYLFRVLRTWGVRGSWRRRIAAPFFQLRSLIGRRAPPDPGVETRRIDSFGPAYDEMAERARNSPWRGQWKPADYLTWRYGRCPIRSYTIIEASRQGRPLGAVVLRVGHEASRDAWLVDLVTDLAEPRVVGILLDAAAKHAYQEGAALLWTFASSHRARKHLAAAGFVNTRITPHFTLRPQAIADTAIPPEADWNFWHGDGDVELYR